MLDFQALAEAKTAAQGINDKVHQRFVEAYQNAVKQVEYLHSLSCQNPERRLPEKELRAAVETLSRVIDLKPSMPHPYALYSYLFFLMGNLFLARKYLQKARKLNPDFPKIAELDSLYDDFEALEQLHQQLPSESTHAPAQVKELSSFEDFDLPDL